MTVRVRIAPSPTGFIHIGNLRSALYNELFARKNRGTLILRIEDTDRDRYVEGAAETYCRSLELIGITPDEGVWVDENGDMAERGPHGPYVQSKRRDLHASYARQLMERGLAYPCFCTEERLADMRKRQHEANEPTRYDRTCRNLHPDEAKRRIANGEPYVIRLAMPREGSVTFRDEIRGDVTFDWKEVDDQIIIKSDGMPTYHLASTCDDHDMQITHVIRGEEWLSSTPKHIFIYKAFGWDVPTFAHLPLLLNENKSKLSKRQGDVAVEDFLKRGYLPEAILNFVALLGWNPTGDREIYSHEELQRTFDLQKVNKAGSVVNLEKLDWMNAQYLKEQTDERFFEYVKPELEALTDDPDFQRRIASIIRERVQKKSDIAEVAKDFVADTVRIDPNIIPWKTQDSKSARRMLTSINELLETLPEQDWQSPNILESNIKKMIEDNGWKNGDVLWPLRVALSGKMKSPPPFELLYVLGKERSLARIRTAIALLNE